MNIPYELRSLALTIETDGHQARAAAIRKAADDVEEIDEIRHLLGIKSDETTALDVLRAHPDWQS